MSLLCISSILTSPWETMSLHILTELHHPHPSQHSPSTLSPSPSKQRSPSPSPSLPQKHPHKDHLLLGLKTGLGLVGDGTTLGLSLQITKLPRLLRPAWSVMISIDVVEIIKKKSLVGSGAIYKDMSKEKFKLFKNIQFSGDKNSLKTMLSWPCFLFEIIALLIPPLQLSVHLGHLMLGDLETLSALDLAMLLLSVGLLELSLVAVD